MLLKASMPTRRTNPFGLCLWKSLSLSLIATLSNKPLTLSAKGFVPISLMHPTKNCGLLSSSKIMRALQLIQIGFFSLSSQRYTRLCSVFTPATSCARSFISICKSSGYTNFACSSNASVNSGFSIEKRFVALGEI